MNRSLVRGWLVVCAHAGAALCALGGELFVTSLHTDEVLRYDTTTGSLLASYSGADLNGAISLAISPAGTLYVGGVFSHNVVSFDIASGTYNGVFRSFSFPEHTIREMGFSPAGDVLVQVASVTTGISRIRRFHPVTGAELGTLVELDNMGGFTFGPDGDLYVTDRANNQILEYDGTTGSLIGVFASGGLAQPQGLAFGPDGNLYVADAAANAIVRFDGTSGALLGTLDAGIQLESVRDVAFGPDDGLLYAAVTGNGTVRRYDVVSGTFVDVFATGVVAYQLEVIPEPSVSLGLLVLLGVGARSLTRLRR